MAGAGGQHHPPGAAGGAAGATVTPATVPAGPGDDSSDSEAEQEGPQKLIRKVSTSGQIRTKETRVQSLDWKIPWRREWLPTPVFFPGNPLDRGAWWAAVHGVAKSRTQWSN